MEYNKKSKNTIILALETLLEQCVDAREYDDSMNIEIEQINKLINTIKKEGEITREKDSGKYLDLREDLISFYGIDNDNCRMTNIDWVTEIALLMSNHKHQLQVSDIAKYKNK